MNRAKPIRALFFAAAAGLLFLAGCNTAAPAGPTAVPTAAMPATPTTPPTATPLPEKVVLVGGQEESFAAVQALVQELADRDGFVFETMPALDAGMIAPEWKIAVFLSLPGNLPDLLSAAPQTQFVVISPADIQSGANLTVIRIRRELEVFTAGYTTALAGYDWRTAGLLPSDTPMGEVLSDAFRNGQLYLCGTCTPYYAPFAKFPLVKMLPSAASPLDWQTAMQEMALSYIYSVYVAPEAATPELYSYLITLNVPITGGMPPPDEVRPLYAASIRSDVLTPLQEVWAELLAGQGGKTLNAAIQLSDVNPDLLSPGRQMQIEKMIEDLTSGWINPFSPALE
ncbi:MAG: hypothetical protein IT308_07300 [Anaerolineaceae bacterium]|nr:hypothetical protein [Anaerolineaceae bacterium]